ncbi:hypothetical protein HMN09_01317800 [Mycena chlorophos]|uniref:Cupredoxin n=1 Tax=Mycena chlorophos TaxID=658473 RepID=A0A8H6RZ14_MYCCL|nr:hypothetical protein HMN09_01317800 [Mycena chlorophos]
MFFSLAATLATVAAVAQAGNIIPITVGAGGKTVYSPNNVNASVGDTVVFSFGAPNAASNHTVTQSTLKSPCEPVAGGFDSGWVEIANTSTAPAPTFNLTITNASVPIWFFCKQLKSPVGKPHCELDMVGVINLGAASFDAFTSAAVAATAVGQEQGGLSGLNALATALPAAQGSGQSVIVGATGTAAGSAGGSQSSGTSSGAPASTNTHSGAMNSRAGGVVSIMAGLAAVAMML